MNKNSFKYIDNSGKKLYKCIKTYASEIDVYGIDFIKGKKYYGKREDKEGFYFDSTENGMCVWITNEELKEYFIEV